MYFRVDMNQTIASGHVMRCLAIADAFKEYGEESVFILADDEAKELIESKGYQTIILHSNWNHLEDELEKLVNLIEDRNIKELFIDSYQVTDTYLQELRRYVKTIYLDDLNRMKYPVDMLFCYSRLRDINKMNEQYQGTDTKLFAGTKYVPLRREFWDLPCKALKSGQCKKILVTTGGTDPYDLGLKIAERAKKEKDREYTIVCGMQNKNYNRLLEYDKQYSNIRVLFNVKNMASLMNEMDYAITAAGTTIFELCACKIPSICYVLADNQLELARFMDDERIMIYAGDIRVSGEDVLDKMEQGINDYDIDAKKRERIIQKMSDLVDGKGALNIVKQIRA